MRRIDNMTADEVLDFVLQNLSRDNCGVCEIAEYCDRHEEYPTCDETLKTYLTEEISTKKRFQSYNSMEKAHEDFKKSCIVDCTRCIYGGGGNTSICFAKWLDEVVKSADDNI